MKLIYAGILLGYPLIWARLFGYTTPGYSFFELVTPVALNLLVICILLWRAEQLYSICLTRETKVLLCSGGVLFLGAVVQCMNNTAGNWSMLIEGLWIFPLILLAVVESDFTRKTLPFLLVFLGGISCSQTIYEFFVQKPGDGLVANWNWNAALLLCASGAFVELLRRSGVRKRSLLGWGIGLIVANFILCRYMFGFPKGPWIALLLLGDLLLMRFLYRCGRRTFLWAIAANGLLLCAGLWYSYGHITTLMARDVRFDLWQATIKLFCDQPWGVSPMFYADRVAAYIPGTYHLRPLAAELHAHPHNETLYAMVAFGVLGGTAAIIMVWYPIVRVWRNLAARSIFPLGLTLYLLIYGQLDVILDSWPMRAIFALAVGLVYAELIPKPRKSGEEKGTLFFFWARIGAVALAMIIFAEFAVTGMARYYLYLGYRSRTEKNKMKQAAYLNRSVMLRPSAPALYLLAQVRLFDEKRPDQTEQLIRRLHHELGFTDFLHSHGLLARALAAQGKLEDALVHFAREEHLFPYGPGNLYYYAMTLNGLKRTEESRKKLQQMYDVAKLRDLPPERMNLWVRPLYVLKGTEYANQ